VAELHDRIREFWDRDARTYDDAASHAVSDPIEAAAWRAAIRDALPEPPGRVLDAGAGTGSLSLLAAELGHLVTALDLSSEMLVRAERKAAERGLELDIVVGSVDGPPPGPFDAVMQRHVLWTVPNPVSALRAWRAVAPGGRLVLFEGMWDSTAITQRAKDLLAEGIRRLASTPDHHAPYPKDVLAEFPLAHLPSPLPLIEAVHEAGWRAVRLRRLRDVEWAARLHEPRGLGWLEQRPRYAIIADA
jgi:SAM-dependent methyltransferase